MLHEALCGAKVVSRCCMELCVEPRWQVDVVWSLGISKVISKNVTN